MTTPPLIARIHFGWLTSAVVALLLMALVFDNIHYQGTPCEQDLAIQALQRVDASDLSRVANGSLVAVHGALVADAVLDDGLIDTPIQAIVLERVVQKLETRFGTRVEQGAKLHTRRHVDTATEQWTLAGENDFLPVIEGQRLSSSQLGQWPERIGEVDLWPAEQTIATWTFLTPKSEVLAALSEQGFVPDPDAPGFYLGQGGFTRVAWRAVATQSLTWIGAKQTSEFDGQPTIGNWRQGSQSIPRQVYAGVWDPIPAWREAKARCLADQSDWPLRFRVNAVMLLPLFLSAFVLALALTRVVRDRAMLRARLLITMLLLSALNAGLFALTQIGSMWPLPGWTLGLLPAGLSAVLLRRSLGAEPDH